MPNRRAVGRRRSGSSDEGSVARTIARLERRQTQQAAVADLGRVALLGADPEVLFSNAVERVASCLGVRHAAVLARGTEGLVVRARFGEMAVPGPVAPGRPTIEVHSLADQAPIVRSGSSGRPVDAAPTDLDGAPVASAIATVIRLPSEPFGVLAAYSARHDEFSEDDTLFVRNVANVLAGALGRSRAEAELRDRDLEHRLAFAAGRMGSWRWDPASGAVHWSPELEALYGFAPGEFGGDFEAYVAALHPDDRAGARAAIDTATAAAREFVVEHRIIRRGDGAVRWIEGRGGPLHDDGGRVSSWVGVSIDVTERVERDEALRAREAESRLAFAAGRMGSWRWRADEQRGTWSPELEALVGLEAGDYDGSWESFVRPILPEDHELVRDAVLGATTRGDFAVRYRIRHADGSIRGVETRGSRLGEADWIGVTIDMTERLEAEARLREAHAELAQTLARLDSLLEFGPSGFAFFDLDLRFVGLNELFSELTGLGVGNHLGRGLEEVLPAVAADYRRAVAAIGSTTVPDPIELTTAEAGAERHWLLTVYPVRAEDGPVIGYGTLAVDISEQKRRERAARLTGAASELVIGLESEELTLEEAAAVAVPDFADFCVIHVRSRAGIPRRFAAAHVESEIGRRLSEAAARWPLDIDRVLAWLGDRAAWIADVSSEQRRTFVSLDPEEQTLADRHGARSVIVVPLRAQAGAAPMGVAVFAYSPASGRRYREEDVGLATDLADRFAQMLERVYLSREAGRARARLDLLARLGNLMGVALDSTARLEAAVDLVLSDFADLAAVYLPGPDDDLRLSAVGTTGMAPTERRDRLQAARLHAASDDSVPVRVMRTGTTIGTAQPPADLADTLAFDRPARASVPSDRQTVLTVPLPGEDGPLGVMVFATRDPDRGYEDPDVTFAEELARRVAPAVENAIRFEQEAETAETLQRSLLPERLATLPGLDVAARYLPGSRRVHVGGDWYDTLALPEGTLLVAIGDVVGHGARAATWMGKLRAIVQFCALDGLGPAATLTRLDHFCQTLPGGDLATALIGHYDAARHRLTFASAGHPPPLLRTAGTARPGLSWAGRGPVLGAAPDSAFEEATVAIEPGSVMVLYTDGLVERRTESIDTGFARLLAVVGDGTGGLEPLADRIIEETLEHDQPADDVAMLVLRAGGSGAGLRLELSRDPRELAALRARLRTWLCETGATGDEIEELMIAVNELAANAIEHPGPQSQDRFEVVGDAAGNEVMIAVSDRGSWRPPSGATDERGRGLELAREFSDALTVDASSDRTTVRIRRHLSRPVTSAR